MQAVRDAVRHVVSGKKKRFRDGKWDLDLSYINDRVIAMGFPSEQLEGIYRNPLPEVAAFLDHAHHNHFRIYNLCQERQYDPKKFQGEVVDYGFEDHSPPSMALIRLFCADVFQWLDKDPQNVAVVHCKGGKGRTGVMISCFLMFSRQCSTAQAALSLFAHSRTRDGSGVTSPAQRRFVVYWERELASNVKTDDHRRLVLKSIRMHTVPNFKIGGGCDPFVAIRVKGKTVFYSKPLKGKKGKEVVDMDCNHTPVVAETNIEFYHQRFTKGKIFSLWLHTGQIKGHQISFYKRDLDGACKDQHHRHFSPQFRIELFFEDPFGGNEQGDVCGNCKKTILESDFSMTLRDKDGRPVLFHISCLSCSKCSRLLTDSQVIVDENQEIHCVRCEPNFFPVCQGCHKPISEGPSSVIGGKAYHRRCIACALCGRSLKWSGFKDSRGQPVCPQGCPGFNVELQSYVSAEEMGYSDDDDDGSVGSELPVFDEDPHSLDMWDPPASAASASTPHAADPHHEPLPTTRPLEEEEEEPELSLGRCLFCREEVVSAAGSGTIEGRVCHRGCLLCYACGLSLSPEDAKLQNGACYCVPDWKRMFTCAECHTPLAGQYMEADGVGYHRTCFVCAHCKQPLQKGMFHTKDEKRYCSTDYNELFCHKCGRCQKPIRTKFYNANGRPYHPICFSCSACSGPLPDGEFYANETNTDIVCKSCRPKKKSSIMGPS